MKNIEPISVVNKPSSPVSDKTIELTALSRNNKVAFSFPLSKKLKTLFKSIFSFSYFQQYIKGPSPAQMKCSFKKNIFVNGNLLIKYFLKRTFFSLSIIIIFPLFVAVIT